MKIAAYRVATIAAALLIAGIALIISSAAPAIAQTSSSSSAQSGLTPDRAFRAQAAEFVEAEMRLYPEHATRLGDHRFDNRVDDLSRNGIDEVIRHAKK